MKNSVRINHSIRANELRVLANDGSNLGLLSKGEAMKLALEAGLDLVEISPNANPPVARIVDFGKWQYAENKKKKEQKQKTQVQETKNIQVKIGTGDHDLELKAKQASKFLSEGHRVKIDLYLRGRAKYLDRKFLEARLDRVLKLITEEFKIIDPIKPGPKGLSMTVDKERKK